MDGVALNWTNPEFDGARLLELRLYKHNSSDPTNWSLLEVLDTSEDGFFDSNATVGLVHRYRICAVNSAGEGEPCAPVSAVHVILPTAPLGLDATPNSANGTVNLTWQPPDALGGSDITGYTVYRGGTDKTVEPLVGVGNVTSYVDTSVKTGVIYYYAVSAENIVGEGPMGGSVYVKPVQPPSVPRSFLVTPGDGSSYLSWRTPVDDGGSTLKGYRIYRGTSVDGITLLTELPARTNDFQDPILRNGETYYYFMRAVTDVSAGEPTETVSVVPFGLPGAPVNLTAEGSDGCVVLRWSPPDDDGGRPLEGYWVFYGAKSGSLSESTGVGNTTTYRITGLTNGVKYYSQVSAINERGEGPRSRMAEALPMAVPGVPLEFEVVPGRDDISLVWSPPSDWGGATIVSYVVLRGVSEFSLEPLMVNVDACRFTDTTALRDIHYWYAVQAENPMGLGEPTPVQSGRRLDAPGPVLDLTITSGNGWIGLSWSSPVDDGGSPVIEYMLLKGTEATTLFQMGSVSLAVEYVDTDVDNGRTYFYSVYAINIVGNGGNSTVVNATPWAKPNPPMRFTAEYDDGKVVISWGEPMSSSGNAPVTGYVVLRGLFESHLVEIADLGLVPSYTDGGVETDVTYYYQVVAKSEVGLGDPTTVLKVTTSSSAQGGSGLYGLLLILVILVVTGLILGYVVVGRSRESAEEAEGMVLPPGAPSRADGVEPLSVEVEEAAPTGTEEVLVVYNDGRLISSCSKDGTSSRDGEMMSGMLIAIQGIIQDGLHQSGSLESVRYGDINILLAVGEHVTLALVLHNQPSDELRKRLESNVQAIEATYAGVIEEWTGDPDVLHGMDDLVSPLLELAGVPGGEGPPGDVADQVVSVLSAIDFYRGYVRLKVAALNNTDETMVDASIQIRYDTNMLRLEWIEPGTLSLKGDRLTLGVIKPGEKKTAAFIFDPQVCQDTAIDGTLTYYDSKGDYVRLDMKRRRADVVCPVFFTRESANTAMLRRLVKERLRKSDHRVFTYPSSLAPEEVLWVGKQALGMGDLQLVREFVESGPPYEAEAWYYGETKVKTLQMVIRIGVVQEKRVLEIFAASTSLEPVTGLIAEFRRELERIVKEDFPPGTVIEPTDDEAVRKVLRGRALLLDDAEDEGTEGESDDEGG